MSWGWSGMLKSRSDLDVVFNRLESIRSLIGGYIPLGARDIQVQSSSDFQLPKIMVVKYQPSNFPKVKTIYEIAK